MNKKEIKQKWMAEFEKECSKRDDYKAGRINWDTATYLFNQGKSPAEAANNSKGSLFKEDISKFEQYLIEAENMVKVRDDNGINYTIPKDLENKFSEIQDELIKKISPKHKGYIETYDKFRATFKKYQTTKE
jgi:hypothetical protein